MTTKQTQSKSGASTENRMESFEREIYTRYFEIAGFKPMKNDTRTASLDYLISHYEAFFFDAFGTFYNQKNYIYPGAREAYNKVRQSKKEMRLVTNAASQSIPQMLESLKTMGIPFREREILSSGDLFKDFAQKNAIREAFYIGRPAGISFLEKAGVSHSYSPEENTVIVSAAEDDPRIFEAAVQILKGKNSKLIVLNPDAYAPRINSPREPVSGAYAHKLYKATQAKTFFFGKPFPELFEKAIQSLPRKMPTVMIGDTLATDIGGALASKIDAALIIGRNTPQKDLAEDEAALKLRPTYYLESF